jgi:hypothetical protein
MTLNASYWKAFLLFFFSLFLFCYLLLVPGMLGVAALLGGTFRAGLGVAILITVSSALFAWFMTLHPESSDENLRRWQAEELLEEARRLFLRSNPVGWLIRLWQKAA